MRTVHLTCFDAFGALRENPTRALVAALPETPGWRTIRTVLPTSYAGVGAGVDGLFGQRPDALLMFGYTSQTDRLRLEHLARNRDGSRRPDNDGRLGRPVILPGAAPAYPSTVDLAPVLLDNVYYVTTRENAARLEDEADERQEKARLKAQITDPGR